MNSINIIGRLTKDPDLKYTTGKGIAFLNIIVAVKRQRSKEEITDFLPVVIWGKPAELTATYTKKGEFIGITGELHSRSYDDELGNKRMTSEIVAEKVQFLGNKSTNENQDIEDSKYEFDITEMPEEMI